MKPGFLFCLSPFLVFLCGCTNNSPDDLTATDNQPLRYSSQIKSIIDNNCTACHQDPPVSGAPMPLLTYQEVKDAITHRGLIDRISRPQGATGMMPNSGTRLPQQQINQIVQWQDEGFAE